MPIPFMHLFGYVALVATSLLVTVAPSAIQAQDVGSRPNVFFDCNGPNCNSTYFRTEIPWVNWVLDTRDSDVHVIVTSQSTGAGGREYQIEFIGREAAEDYSDEMAYSTLPTDTDREELDGIAYTLSVGLARFANQNGFAVIATIEGIDPEEGGVDPGERVVAANEVDDPWNLWVFRINGNANLDGEDTREETRIRGSVSANRVSPTWKLDYDAGFNFNERVIETSDTTTFKDSRTDWNVDALMVYSIADHWSIGLDIRGGRQTRVNQDFRVEVLPAIEYSFFPYEDATRRSLTAFYEIGPTYRNYSDTTIFNKLEETRYEQLLEIEFAQRQTWGDASVSTTFSHILDDFEKRNISLEGDVDYRITRGLSLTLEAEVSWVSDQIFLEKEGNPDEILLRLQQRQTDFTWGIQAGFSFQFGSIFNNVVNNRFRGARGFGGGGGFGGFRGF